MDKYQLNLLGKIEFTTKEDGASFSLKDEKAWVVQPENAYIEQIEVTANGSALKSIIVDGTEFATINNQIKFIVSFRSDSKSITFCFNNGVVDDCTLPILLTKTSKEAWDKKIKSENRANLIKQVEPVINSGFDVINVIFTLINGAKYAVAELFYKGRKMGEFKNDDNKSYISIGGLAFGYYSIILSIFDENNNLIVSTNKIFTQLKPYTQDLK